MLPITEIHVGDQYENPFLRPNGLTFVVLEVNKDEKMIKVQAINQYAQEIGKAFWKKNTDRMFSENWRVFCGENIF